MIDIIAHSAEKILYEIKKQQDINVLKREEVLDHVYFEQLCQSLLALSKSNSETTSQDLYSFMVMVEASAAFIEESLKQVVTKELTKIELINKTINWVKGVLFPWLENMWKAV
jgi:hypothetical protein